MQTSALCYQLLMSLCMSYAIAQLDLAFKTLSLKFCAQMQPTFPV